MTDKKNKKDKNKQGKSVEQDLWSIVSKSVNPITDRQFEFNVHLQEFMEEKENATKPNPKLSPPNKKHGKAVKIPNTARSELNRLKTNLNVNVLGFLSHGDSPGVDRRTAQRLKRGRLDIDARLDLHGHSLATAHQRLNSFVFSSHKAGHRCILVVTGKGDKGKGVIRASVPQWLNDVPLRPMILSYSYAQPADGGEGALYVLLKRKR
ncbi:MAG: Smr/MutS family protein [Alphaproteobacteria bacterium]|nr:Smr/MutS family protein [Alphaproteobacteria bacterium]